MAVKGGGGIGGQKQGEFVHYAQTNQKDCECQNGFYFIYIKYKIHIFNESLKTIQYMYIRDQAFYFNRAKMCHFTDDKTPEAVANVLLVPLTPAKFIFLHWYDY